jgi:transcriptional regulator with XRE-family HTH domain
MTVETFAELWPSGPISEAEWRQRMDDLATEAEALIGRRPTLQQSCRLAMQWAGLCWPAMSPEVIAASCRASLLPGCGPPGVVVGGAIPDQLDEIWERLDAIFEAGRADPSALIVEQKPPTIIRPPTNRDHAKPYRAKRAQFEAQGVEVPPLEAEPEPEPQQEPQLQPLHRPRPPLRPVAERMAARPAAPEPLEAAEAPTDPEPLQLPEPLELPPPLELEELQPTPEAEPTPEALEPPSPPATPDPPPKRRQPAGPPPPGWFSQSELGDLLGVSAATISRWRRQGEAGSEGSDWQRIGKAFHYSPALAESLLQQAQAATASRTPAPAVPPADPERWVGTPELGAWFGLSAPWVAKARRLQWIREGTHYRKPQPGEFPGDPHRSRGWVHDLQPCLIALAEASGRPMPNQPINDPQEARRASQEDARMRFQAYRQGRQCLAELQQESTPPLGADLEAASADH